MKTSAEVAKWGEAWLKDWIDAAPSGDREQREWIASGWRSFSLDDWLRSGQSGDPDEVNASHLAHQHLSLYPRERSGLLIWRAFSAYRAAGLPVPENVLKKFDQWAALLELASGANEVASAIEMTGQGGGPQGASHLAKVERQREIVSSVHRLKSRGWAPQRAYKQVADERSISVAAVRAAYTRWFKPSNRRKMDRESDSVHLLRTLGK